jgi:hypothetical protein
MRGARLLLLPALGLLCALFRCLRHLPSLLRHAALLAVSEWRCRPCSRGSRTLHWDYYSVIKKPVFLQHQARSRLRGQHVARPQQRAQNARHVAQHDCATPRTRFLRSSKMPMKYSFSMRLTFCVIAESALSARRACDHQTGRNDALSIPTNLCKKISAQRLSNPLPSAEFGKNRANRPGSDSLKTNRGRRRTQERQQKIIVALVRLLSCAACRW